MKNEYETSRIRNNPESTGLDLNELEISLADRVEATVVERVRLPATEDKWDLSSAVQKLIRRGRSAQAVAAALRLFQIDPAYLPRRLPIIAVEDVGLGDLGVCIDVMLMCSASAWWRSNPVQTIGFLVASMAEAIKCRAACDAVCLAEVHRDSPRQLSRLLAAGPDALVELATDRGETQLLRTNALRVLGGIATRQGSDYRTLSSCNLPALDKVARLLELPPPVRWLMARHRRSGNMSAMFPIAVEAGADRCVKTGRTFPHALDFVEGIPLSALDKHSDLGRSALREFVLSSRRLKEFATRNLRGGHSAIGLVSMAMFHAESSLLDRYLSSHALYSLTEATEESEMAHLGLVEGADRRELYEILESEAGRLAAIRLRRLQALHELDTDQRIGGIDHA